MTSPRRPTAITDNGGTLALDAIPLLPLVDLHNVILDAVAAGQRVSALFGVPAADANAVDLYAVLANDRENRLGVVRATVRGNAYLALTPRCPQAHLFEREIAEQFGLLAEGHPWFKPVRYRRSWRPGQDAWDRPTGEAIRPAVGDFYRVEGEEVHEVAVGPVHAGVIEPGHFRFQCHGEEVFHLEIALGYQHRGVEEALRGGPDRRSIHYAETLCGDSTAAHALAWCQILESLAACRTPARAQAIRGIALELERVANHIGDLGALANDVGFLPTASYCGRLRGDVLNLTALVCGNRFSRGLVRPGGVAHDIEPARSAELLRRLDAVERDTTVAVELLWNTPSVMARFEDTGTLPTEPCRELGMVGLAARASGVVRDIRQDQPFGIYRFVHIPVSSWHTGDVFARAWVRWLEIQQSIVFIREQAASLPGGALSTPCGPLAPNRLAISLVEGWRGEVCHVALTDAQGRFARYKVVDPSFHNWSGLAWALRGQGISDFPLCNKSFNLSYCGHDL